MADIQKLEQLVRERYEKKDPNRDRWSDWMYANHVLDVAIYAEQLATRYGVSPDVCRAAALLHDIADAEMSRENPRCEEESLIIAEQLLKEANFNDSERADILNDALPFHSCHGDERPKTLVGKILSTADALSHLNSEFYGYFNAALANERSNEEQRQYAGKRLARDFDKKIAFDEIRKEVRERYEYLIAMYA
jgi:putative nucleotidyltransferase with HDIG domain